MLIAIQHDVRKVQSNRCGYVWNRMCGDTAALFTYIQCFFPDIYESLLNLSALEITPHRLFIKKLFSQCRSFSINKFNVPFAVQIPSVLHPYSSEKNTCIFFPAAL